MLTLKQGKIPGEKVLCSHDLFKADEEGFLYFLGRTDDIIKTRGEKVSPVEIENVIYKIKGVREAAVIGVTDKIKGESIIAFVTLAAKENITESHIMKTCIENLELFIVPERIIILDEMPKSPNGKIDKLNLKKSVFTTNITISGLTKRQSDYLPSQPASLAQSHHAA